MKKETVKDIALNYLKQKSKGDIIKRSVILAKCELKGKSASTSRSGLDILLKHLVEKNVLIRIDRGVYKIL